MSQLLTSLFEFKAWANAATLPVIARLDPAGQAEARHAALRLMNHIHVVDNIFRAHLGGQPHGHGATNTVDTPTVEALGEAMASTDAWYVDFVAGVDPARLAEAVTFRFTDGDGGRMSRQEMLLHVITHGGYHRGAVGRILSQQGLAPPRELFTGHLHRTEPQRRAAG